MLKILIIAIVGVTLVTVIALAGSSETDDFLKAMEDEEQLEYIKKWRAEHERR